MLCYRRHLAIHMLLCAQYVSNSCYFSPSLHSVQHFSAIITGQGSFPKDLPTEPLQLVAVMPNCAKQ